MADADPWYDDTVGGGERGREGMVVVEGSNRLNNCT